MDINRENIENLKSVANEVYAIETQVRLGKRVSFQKLLDTAWRLANLSMSIEQPTKRLLKIEGGSIFYIKKPLDIVPKSLSCDCGCGKKIKRMQKAVYLETRECVFHVLPKCFERISDKLKLKIAPIVKEAETGKVLGRGEVIVFPKKVK